MLIIFYRQLCTTDLGPVHAGSPSTFLWSLEQRASLGSDADCCPATNPRWVLWHHSRISSQKFLIVIGNVWVSGSRCPQAPRIHSFRKCFRTEMREAVLRAGGTLMSKKHSCPTARSSSSRGGQEGKREKQTKEFRDFDTVRHRDRWCFCEHREKQDMG